MPIPPTPPLTVDCVVFDRDNRVLLIRRKYPPFAGSLALPGGFVDIGETVEEACRRELMEETGVQAGKLTLVGVYSDPRRDPRRHTCSVAFVTRARSSRAEAGSDAVAVEWIKAWQRVDLAFDHRDIIRDADRLMR